MEPQLANLVMALREELDRRRRRNRGYSLRAFARHLELDPSHLSKLLRGARGLSRARVASIGRKLGLGEESPRLADWCCTVVMDLARGESVASLAEKIARILKCRPIRDGRYALGISLRSLHLDR